jgi:hypothetical protein
MATNGKSSCEFYVFVLICSFVGYELYDWLCLIYLWFSLWVSYAWWGVDGLIFFVGHQSRMDGGGSLNINFFLQ